MIDVYQEKIGVTKKHVKIGLQGPTKKTLSARLVATEKFWMLFFTMRLKWIKPCIFFVGHRKKRKTVNPIYDSAFLLSHI